jgi:hypothetical protein
VAFQEDPVAALTPIRLLKTYRGVSPGGVIHATPALARRLVSLGIGSDDVRPGSVCRPQAAERAVAPGAGEAR